MELDSRGLSDSQPILGRLSASQGRAILAAGLSCACLSLLATLITLRWFAAMKRLFRHQLVLFLILSDTFKALWYFVFPIVVYARGPVASSSKWCQASGFLLAFSIEASDFAILMIALHAVLYVFRPPVRMGEGGLYPYRKWIPAVWLGLPLIMASLAFVNEGNAYVTAGGYCYLPQRPFWYRLALTWIPRYIILIAILLMYIAISVYVHIKFRGFKNLASPESSHHEKSRKGSLSDLADSTEKELPLTTPMHGHLIPEVHIPPEPRRYRPTHMPRSQSYQSQLGNNTKPLNQAPWESMSFMTSQPIQDTVLQQSGIAATDFVKSSETSDSEATEGPNRDGTVSPRNLDVPIHDSRKQSDTPTMNSALTGETASATNAGRNSIHSYGDETIVDPVKRARAAIRQQLRFLFIYPAVYVLMWVFPFVNHCLLYSDYWGQHPIFWLQVVGTCSLSLQAGINCVVFSWREKPWRRVNDQSVLSLQFWRKESVAIISRVGRHSSVLFASRHASDATTRGKENDGPSLEPVTPSKPARGANWWEEEGKKRKDSVWLGTDLLTQIATRASQRSTDVEDHRSASV